MPTESWVVNGPQVVEVDTVVSLRVSIVAGRVDVVAHDDPSRTATRVEVTSLNGRPVEMSLTDGELRLGYREATSSWDAFLDRVRMTRSDDTCSLHVAVPRGTKVRVATVTGEALLAGVAADCRLSSVSGALVADGTDGALVVRSVSGAITVGHHDGDLRVETVSGDVTAAGALSRVTVNTVSGDMSIDLSERASAVSLSTATGDATLRVPAGRGLRVAARTVSGHVIIDGQEHKGGGHGRSTVDVTTGDGGCYVSLSGVSSDLTIVRAAGGAEAS